jgi:CubicO group peptidase (beta-lactamase class C family)
MTRPQLAVIPVIALALFACATPAPLPGLAGFRLAAPEAVGMSRERLARLDRVLDAHVDAGRLPGYQLLVARRGRLLHRRVYGRMDLEADRPLAPDTIFRIYSMSKVVTGVAAMIALERGQFLLGDRLSKYLPAFAAPKLMKPGPRGKTELVPAGREIAVLDLLRHTSGLSYSFLAPAPLRARYLAASITPGIRGLPPDAGLGPAGTDRDATLADMVERLGPLPLVAEPGSAWHYGVNLDVLGRLIEVTSGQSFPDFLREQLFEPLDMRDTAFFVPDEKLERFAACYGSTPEGGMRLLDAPATSEYRQPPAMPGGGGGLVSTARDYLRMALMLANGGVLDGRRILGRKTVDLMLANHLPESEFGLRPLGAAAARSFANDGAGVGFGLSGSVLVHPELTGLPASAGTFSWGGAASTFFWVDREEDLAVVFMTQLVLSETYPLRAELLRGVNSAISD